MGLFKKKKRIEEITLAPVEEVNETTIEVIENKIVLPKSIEETKTLINKKYTQLAKGYDNLMYNYYLCKFFSLAVFNKVEDFEELSSLERQISNIRQLYDDATAKVKNINEDNNYADNYLEELYSKIEEAYDNYLGLLSRIDETRRNKYNTLKLSSLAVILNKNGEELEKMDNRFVHFINSFKSLEEASDYIYVNSGELATSLVNSLIRCVQSSNKEEFKKQYNLYYFLKSDVIICLELNEWVELYNKVRHCVNTLRNVDIANYIDFQGYLEEFEIRYLILMINEEKKNFTKGGKNEKNN